MNKNNKVLLIILLVAISLLFRAFNLSKLPVSLSMDEVTSGYASYSILNTGRDEHGIKLPLFFQGIGDYKAPVDVYLRIPFIKIFGLDEFSVRLPNALWGTLTVLLIVLIICELGFDYWTSFLTGFWLSISGWHIFYSRASYDSVTALFFLCLGLYFFIKYIKKNSLFWFPVSLIFFSLAAWSYHAERLYVPIIFAQLLFLVRKRLRDIFLNKKILIGAIVVLLIFVLPFAYTAFFSQGIIARAGDLWVGKQISDASNYYLLIKSIIGQYLNYFDLRFIFWKGIGLTPPNFPDVGLLYLIDALLIVVGIYSLSKSKDTLLKSLAAILIFSGPIPAALTRGDPSQIRILVWIPGIAIIMASALSFILSKKKYWLIGFWVIASLVNMLYFFSLYQRNFAQYNADLWHYGYKEAAQYICKEYPRYNKVILTDTYGIEIPRIKTIPHYYLLFFCKYDPALYIQNPQLFNLEIRQPQWRIDSLENDYLLIGSPWDFPEWFDKGKIIKEINFPNGKPALYFVKSEGI